jgi:peptidoglycan/LPS O-acetylase OafA/YrhL
VTEKLTGVTSVGLGKKSRPEIAAHYGLRGLASVAVVWGHVFFGFLNSGFVFAPGVDWFIRYFQYAVDLFFMLSGFILAYLYALAPLDWKGFFRARAARILPLYYMTLGTMFILLHGKQIFLQHHYQGEPWPMWVANLLLIQEWPGFPFYHSANYPAWSISVEWFLYLAIFPALTVIPAQRRVPAGLVVLGLGVGGYLFWDFREGPELPHLWRGLIGFVTGFFLAHLAQVTEGWKGVRKAERWMGVLVVLLLGIGASWTGLYVGAALLVFYGADPLTWTGRIFAFRPLVIAGYLSYSIYLWHVPAFHLAGGLFKAWGGLETKSLNGQIGFWAVSLGLTGFLSLVGSMAMERPIRRWFAERRIMRKRGANESC